ncbi:lamin tail domain-containing protein [Streptomyces sp. NPDC005423]|uniref:lamin tail domain-containing protein n=1 Tax=Streptomyces sp. NPDC005423 TaxID=3155343 RepID=UPI0033A6BAB7
MTVSTTATARRLAAAALAVGALSAAVTLPASAADHAPHRQSVEITKVQYDVPGRDHSNRALNQEWVEVTNSTREVVNLDRWTLSDREGHTYTFRHYRLGARSSVFVHTGAGHDTRTDLYQNRTRDAWNDRAGTLTLRNDRSRPVSTVTWGHRDGGHHDGWHHGGGQR